MVLVSSEQVSAGHPDKICDQISDGILMEYLSHDKHCRVAVESLIKDYHVVVAGEVTSSHTADIDSVVRNVLKRIGLPNTNLYDITNYISSQSADIALGTNDIVGGAGDQGIMYGYATNETDELLPLPYVLATKTLQYLMNKHYSLLGLDAKAQVTFDYVKNRIDTFLLSVQHSELADIEADVKPRVLEAMQTVAGMYNMNTDFDVLVNPTGRFVVGGSFADSGVTGRKIIADTYGGFAHHGGGAFSGKEATKVDRSAAYMGRKIARDLLRKYDLGLVEVQLAYAIGVAEPVSIHVMSSGGKIYNQEALRYVQKNYDLTSAGIIRYLDLLNVDYFTTASYGHFGKPYLPWEK